MEAKGLDRHSHAAGLSLPHVCKDSGCIGNVVGYLDPRRECGRSRKAVDHTTHPPQRGYNFFILPVEGRMCLCRKIKAFRSECERLDIPDRYLRQISSDSLPSALERFVWDSCYQVRGRSVPSTFWTLHSRIEIVPQVRL
jgi:hypothetical protein